MCGQPSSGRRFNESGDQTYAVEWLRPRHAARAAPRLRLNRSPDVSRNAQKAARSFGRRRLVDADLFVLWRIDGVGRLLSI